MTINEATQLIEEGAASMQLAERTRAEPCSSGTLRRRRDRRRPGGPVGRLPPRARGRSASSSSTRNERIGDAWRKRWDSLRLFTPAKFDGLDGMPFPAPRNDFPTKDEMADYLEAYAARFRAAGAHRRPRRAAVQRGGALRRRGRNASRSRPSRSWSRWRSYQRRKVPGVRARSSRPTSSSCTRATTATRRSSGRAACCSSAPATRAPRSRMELRAAATRPGCRAATPARSRSARALPGGATCSCALVLRVRLPPRADGEDADRAARRAPACMHARAPR